MGKNDLDDMDQIDADLDAGLGGELRELEEMNESFNND